MKKILVCLFSLVAIFIGLPVMVSAQLAVAKAGGQQVSFPTKYPADYVNPFIGASTNIAKAGAAHGLGKTFPGAATPFGMVQVSPNTITGGDNGSGYSYEHEYIEGFAFTQMSGIGWYGDLGNLLTTPTTGPLQIIAGRHASLGKGYRSHYDKKSETANAGFYAAFLTDYGIRAEATAAPHSGMLRFTYPASQQSRIQMDLARRVGGTATEEFIRVSGKDAINGWIKCTPDGGGWGNGDGKADYTVFYYVRFSKPLKNYGAWSAAIPGKQSRKLEDISSIHYDSLVMGATITRHFQEEKGKHLGFYTEFATTEGEEVLMKVGISFVSIENARQNLEKEIPEWDFNQVRKNARDLWNKELSKMKISGGTADQRTIFYTALYHSMIDPRNTTDINGQYMGGDHRVHQSARFVKRSVFSGWDVFRSEFPLQTILNPTVVNDMINSLVTLADESNEQYLERWEFLNAYSGCMIGNPAIVVITDAWNKGIRNFDLAKAYQFARHTEEKFGNGASGFKIPSNDISATLEYAFSEWCMAQLADSLNKKEDALKYLELSKSYLHVFDTAKGWFRPRKEDGSWRPWPAEGRLKQDYGTVESNPYQQGWFIPFDVPALANLLGGPDKMVADLNDFFEKTPKSFTWNNYYNHANEPVHHVPFLFNKLGVPWLTQKWARIVCENAYSNTVEGLVGNDDVGQMSAWYVLAASGLYTVCPGDNRFEICSPVFDEIIINGGKSAYAPGKPFRIVARNNSPANKYIQSAKLNGHVYNKCWLTYQDIIAGGELELEMGSQPMKTWGVEETNR
ncbi:GH92 family glycosyl hydrolase [Chitinophaga polysaccharea]|nr:GH92 family glycosyl hydrolase [Chitinophaga polysaccharea]